MKKGMLILGIIVIILAALAVGIVSSYNGLVSMETAVDASWAEVENVLQRRMDLIPSLVAVAKGYISHEERVFTEIAEARSRLLSANTQSEQVEASLGVEQALMQLWAVSEAYPELKSDTQFVMLMDELSATENKIAQERRRYNTAVGAWNVKIKQFPTVIIANMFGKEPRLFFEARPGADEPPKIEF